MFRPSFGSYIDKRFDDPDADEETEDDGDKKEGTAEAENASAVELFGKDDKGRRKSSLRAILGSVKVFCKILRFDVDSSAPMRSISFFMRPDLVVHVRDSLSLTSLRKRRRREAERFCPENVDTHPRAKLFNLDACYRHFDMCSANFPLVLIVVFSVGKDQRDTLMPHLTSRGTIWIGCRSSAWETCSTRSSP